MTPEHYRAMRCKHEHLRFTPDAGGLYLDCEDCPRRFIAGLKTTFDTPDYFARSEILTETDKRSNPMKGPRQEQKDPPSK